MYVMRGKENVMLAALFDGRCFICLSARKVIKSLDWLNRIEFIDLHEREVWRSRWPELDEARLMGAIHVLQDDGRLCAGYDGIRRLLKEVPPGWPFWLLMRLPGLDWLGRRVYRLIADRRCHINRLCGRQACEGPVSLDRTRDGDKTPPRA